MSLKIILEFFLCSVALGISGFSAIASTKLTGVGFFKLAMSVCLGCLMVALPTHFALRGISFDYMTIAYVVALGSMGLSYLVHKDQKSAPMWLLYVVQNLALIYLIWGQSSAHVMNFLYLLLGALYLGVVVYAMVLGHWYLVVPKLTEQPLKTSMAFYFVFLVAKLAFSTAGYLEHQSFFEQGTMLGEGYMFNWLLLTMRAAWGYLIVGIMGYFSWRLISIRSIQSATGMLYAMVFFVFIGELISGFLFFKYGMKI